MKIKSLTPNGFTLIEIIVTLILVGMLGIFVAFGFLNVSKGYIFAEENIEISQKAEIALTRITNEIRECYNCDGPDGTIGLPFTYGNILDSPRQIALNGNNLELGETGDMHILLDQVDNFDLERQANGTDRKSVV